MKIINKIDNYSKMIFFNVTLERADHITWARSDKCERTLKRNTAASFVPADNISSGVQVQLSIRILGRGKK